MMNLNILTDFWSLQVEWLFTTYHNTMFLLIMLLFCGPAGRAIASGLCRTIRVPANLHIFADLCIEPVCWITLALALGLTASPSFNLIYLMCEYSSIAYA